MSLTVQKGSPFSGQYVLGIIATATDWVGTVSLHREYPGVAVFSVPIIVSGDGTKLLFDIPANQILNLDTGVYTLVGNIVSATLDIDTFRIDYITVTAFNGSPATKCKLFGTVLKSDGTPAGKEFKSLVNTADGVSIVLSWDGVDIKAAPTIGDAILGNIIGVETITTKTNAAGYFELYIIQGEVINVTCPAFGKTVQVDTTGLAEKDLSSYF